MSGIDFQKVKLFKSTYLTSIISEYFENMATDEKGTIFLVSPSLETFSTNSENFFKEIWINLYSRNSNFVNEQLKTYILIPLVDKSRKKHDWLDLEPIIQSIDYIIENKDDNDLIQNYKKLNYNLRFIHYGCKDNYSFGLYLKNIIIENRDFKDLKELKKKLKSIERNKIHMILGSSVGAPFGKLEINTDKTAGIFKYDYLIKYDEETEALKGKHCLLKYHINKLVDCLLNSTVISKNDTEKHIKYLTGRTISLNRRKLFKYEEFYLRCSCYTLISDNVTDTKLIESSIMDAFENLKTINNGE